jgi:hypothetical protein
MGSVRETFGDTMGKLRFFALRWSALQLSLFVLTLYLPLAAMVYSPDWYLLNCRFHDRCTRLGVERVEAAAADLTGYFAHRNELTDSWTQKESRHLAEVRAIYDRLAIFASAAVFMLMLSWQTAVVTRVALWNLYLLAGLLLVVPFFTPFWKEVFHPLLFDNELWKNNRADTSWYLMPRLFFRNSFALLIFAAVLLNAIVHFVTKTRIRT